MKHYFNLPKEFWKEGVQLNFKTLRISKFSIQGLKDVQSLDFRQIKAQIEVVFLSF